MKKYTFLKALFSPFKPFKLRFYIGKVKIGTPYFYPRKWVKATPELAHKATLEFIKKEENYNKMNPKYARTIKPYEEIYKEKMRYSYAIPKKIGFDFIGLGWKTKWSDTDYRFEWQPLLSFVFFGYQIAIMVNAIEPNHYWEAWLYYENNTTKTKSDKERIEECKKQFSLKYETSNGKSRNKIDYYDIILKDKYKN